MYIYYQLYCTRGGDPLSGQVQTLRNPRFKNLFCFPPSKKKKKNVGIYYVFYVYFNSYFLIRVDALTRACKKQANNKHLLNLRRNFIVVLKIGVTTYTYFFKF